MQEKLGCPYAKVDSTANGGIKGYVCRLTDENVKRRFELKCNTDPASINSCAQLMDESVRWPASAQAYGTGEDPRHVGSG